MLTIRCDKAGCLKTWCKVFCVKLVLIHSVVIIKILFCMSFYCALIEKHIFHGVKLLLNLFAIAIEETDSKGSALRYFYIYIISTNMIGILFYGIVSTSPANNEINTLINNLCFLASTILVCFINLLQSSAFLILVIFIGIDDNVNIQMEAAFLSILEGVQIITLSLLLAVLNARYSEIQSEKKLLCTVRLVENPTYEEPLLVS